MSTLTDHCVFRLVEANVTIELAASLVTLLFTSGRRSRHFAIELKRSGLDTTGYRDKSTDYINNDERLPV